MPGGTLRVIQRGKTGALHSHLQALISTPLGCSLFLLPPALGKAPWRSCPAPRPALRTQRGEGAPRWLILSRQRPSNERFTLGGSKCPRRGAGGPLGTGPRLLTACRGERQPLGGRHICAGQLTQVDAGGQLLKRGTANEQLTYLSNEPP